MLVIVTHLVQCVIVLDLIVADVTTMLHRRFCVTDITIIVAL
jgi:hypothetical protein